MFFLLPSVVLLSFLQMTLKWCPLDLFLPPGPRLSSTAYQQAPKSAHNLLKGAFLHRALRPTPITRSLRWNWPKPDWILPSPTPNWAKRPHQQNTARVSRLLRRSGAFSAKCWNRLLASPVMYLPLKKQLCHQSFPVWLFPLLTNSLICVNVDFAGLLGHSYHK